MRTLPSVLLVAASQLGAPLPPGPLESSEAPAPTRARAEALDQDDGATMFVGGIFHVGFYGRGWDVVVPPTADAVLAQNGRIIAFGAVDSMASSDVGRRAKRVDLGGAHVFPGFQDAHGHIERLGASMEEVDLTGCASMAELVRRVRARAAEVPAGQWIEGRGWDQALWPGGVFPRHDALSAATPDHPVLVYRVDGVAALANAKALSLAGLDVEPLPADPPGGEILRFEGRATGVLVDSAVEWIQKHVPPPPASTRVRRILCAQEALLAAGLTCVHEMGLDREAIDLYRGLRDDGRLKLRVVGYFRADGLDQPEQFEGLMTDDPQDVFTLQGAKFRVDGALGSRGAALLSDYSDAPGERGNVSCGVDELARGIVAAAKSGLQPAVHAVGDRANRLALDAFELAIAEVDALPFLLPRIEHAQLVAPNDMPRFEALSIIASMQPIHVTSDMHWLIARIGKERANGAYAWKTLAATTPMQLAFGSDFPGIDFHPRAGVYAALTRQDADGKPRGGFLPNERLSAAVALAAYTTGAAAAARQDDRRGRIAIGYGCDLTVLDTDLSDLTATTAARALRAEVLTTVVNGVVVFSRR